MSVALITVGTEYQRLWARVSEAEKHRNKIFHGQLTAQSLSKRQLAKFVEDIRAWCRALGAGAQSEVRYNGCGRNSFRKAENAAGLCAKYKKPLANLEEYRDFIKQHMERGRQSAGAAGRRPKSDPLERQGRHLLVK